MPPGADNLDDTKENCTDLFIEPSHHLLMGNDCLYSPPSEAGDNKYNYNNKTITALWETIIIKQ